MRILALFALLTGGVTLVAGGVTGLAVGTRSEQEKKSDEEKKKNDAAQKEEPEGAKQAGKKLAKIDPTLGILTGRVFFKGDPPPAEKIEVPARHPDRAHCVKHVKSERLILGKKKEIKNVVVSIDEKYRPKNKPVPRTVKLDNKNCLFVPHVLAVSVGSTLELSNSDRFMHNTHGLLKPLDGLNSAIPPKGSKQVRLRKPGWGVMICSFHAWMKAHVLVFPHDLFDVTDKSGTYKIVNIPPGTHKVQFWHETSPLKKIERTVTIEAGKTVKLDLQFEAPKT